jgi:glycosyltransferase involved in cell wall biosynthesis
MITVCIPCYNHEKYIIQAILSSLTAGRLVTQILITDDNSGDDSVELIKSMTRKHSKCRYINPLPSTNIGAHERLNLLISQASTEWIAILNSDDFYSSGCFANTDRFTRHNQCSAFFGRINVVDESSHRLCTKIPGTHLEYLPSLPSLIDQSVGSSDWLSLLLNQNFIATTSNFCFRRELWTEIGGFENYRYAHDWAFFIRACALSKVSYNPHFTINYRIHGNNTITENIEKMHRETQYLLQKTIKLLGGFEAVKSKAVSSQVLATLAVDNRHFYKKLAFNAFQVISSASIKAKSCPILYNPNNLPSNDIYAIITASHGKAISNAAVILENDDIDAILERKADGSGFVLVGIIRSAIEAGILLSGRVLVADFNNHVSSGLLSAEGYTSVTSISCQEIGVEVKIEHGEASSSGQSRNLHRLIAPVSLTNKKRILILTGFFAVGGVERYVLDVVKNLGRYYDFCMICMETQGKELGSLLDMAALHGVDIFFLDQIYGLDLKGLISRLEISYQFSACWIINGSTRLWPLYPTLREHLPNARIIDNQVYDHQVGWIDGFGCESASWAHTIIAHNLKIYQRFVGEFSFPSAQVVQLYPCFSSHAFPKALNAVDGSRLGQSDFDSGAVASLVSELGLTPSNRVYLNVARCDKQKNQSFLLDVAYEMQELDPSAIFVIIGDGPCRIDLETKIAEKALSNVRMQGFKRELRQYYCISTMLVITSIFEGLPVTMLEAMACGLPVCSSDVGDIGDVMARYGYGFIYNEFNAREVAEMLKQCDVDQYSLDLESFYAEFSSGAISLKYRYLFEQEIP